MTMHVERGFGESLVFIPPLGGTAAQFETQLVEFGADYRTIAVTLSGNGEAAELDLDAPDIIATQTEQLVGLLSDLGVRRAHVVGVGYGGAVAQRFALDHPSLTRRLVLCDTWGDTTARTPPEKVLALLIRSSTLAYRTLPRSLLAAGVLNRYVRWPVAGKVLADEMRSARPAEMAAQFRAYTTLHNADALRELTCPTLCLAGDAAPWLVALARRLAVTIPDARMEIIKNSLDPSHLCQPQLFNQVVRRFLQPT